MNKVKENKKPSKEIYLISYPFPLKNGKMAYLYLPENLTFDDALRMAKYIYSVATK